MAIGLHCWIMEFGVWNVPIWQINNKCHFIQRLLTNTHTVDWGMIRGVFPRIIEMIIKGICQIVTIVVNCCIYFTKWKHIKLLLTQVNGFHQNVLFFIILGSYILDKFN